MNRVYPLQMNNNWLSVAQPATIRTEQARSKKFVNADVVFEKDLPWEETLLSSIDEPEEEKDVFGEHLDVDSITRNGKLGIDEKDFARCEAQYLNEDEYTFDALDDTHNALSKRDKTYKMTIHIDSSSDFFLSKGKRKVRVHTPRATDIAKDFMQFLGVEVSTNVKNLNQVTIHKRNILGEVVLRGKKGYLYALKIIEQYPKESKAFALGYPFVLLAIIILLLVSGVHPM